jgi:hypothetical protein
VISDHRAKAVIRLADLYEFDRFPNAWRDARVRELRRHPVAISRFMAVTLSYVEVDPEVPDTSPYVPLHQFLPSEDPWEPIQDEEEFYDCDWHPMLCGVVDLDTWEMIRRSVRGWDWFPLDR